jgi:hypothetical protein
MTAAALLLLLGASATAVLGVLRALFLAARGGPGRPSEPLDWASGAPGALPSHPYGGASR